MVSRRKRFRLEQNRFSVFLAHVRHILPRHRYDCLLRMRRGSDYSGLGGCDGSFEEAWLKEFAEALDHAFLTLEKGNPGRSGYLRIGHLYRDFFFARFGGFDLTSRRRSGR